VQEGELAALLGEHARRHLVPGAGIGVLRQGSATTACFGVADVRTGEPVTPDTRFGAGSLTKSMVATVIAYLAEAGRLGLDDPVAAHVPELRASGWAGRATVRDLLANRSGLPLRAGLEFGFAGRKDTDDGALARLVADAAEYGPAEGGPAEGRPAAAPWSYTNVGWCVLGRVIETTAQSTWEDAMARWLAARAGMGGTVFAAVPALERRAAGHDITASGPVPAEPLLTRAYGPAGANVAATVADLLAFAGLHLADPALAGLRTVHAEVPIRGWLDAWCLGWARFGWRGGQVWGWDGVVSGERSFLRIMPGQQAAVVLVTNGGTGRAMYRSLLPELMEPAFGIGVPPLDLRASPGAAGGLGRFAGVYAWPDLRAVVTATADGLMIRREEGDSEVLPLDGRTFLADAADPDVPTVAFGEFDAAGRPHVLYEMIWALPRRGG
jgi:CubicO group peptidase (beta-lactamase class C family)